MIDMNLNIAWCTAVLNNENALEKIKDYPLCCLNHEVRKLPGVLPYCKGLLSDSLTKGELLQSISQAIINSKLMNSSQAFARTTSSTWMVTQDSKFLLLSRLKISHNVQTSAPNLRS